MAVEQRGCEKMSVPDETIQDPHLYDELLEELMEDHKLEDNPRLVIDGALRGSLALSAALEDDGKSFSPKPQTKEGEKTAAPAIFLNQITVEGFRGAGPEAKLDIEPGPGLTLVVGRNGTGKSTFAEGLETVLTGTTERWSERKEWKGAWQNVGYQGQRRVSATLLAEGLGQCVAERRWSTDDELESASLVVTPEKHDQQRLDWANSCATARPFLGYRQLGKVVENPADAFDTLNEVLGLELLSGASDRVNGALKQIADRVKAEKQKREECVARLKGSDDDRASQLVTLLGTKSPEPSTVQTKVRETRREDKAKQPELAAFARHKVPTEEEWNQRLASLESSVEEVAASSSQLAERSHRLIQLIDQALPLLKGEVESCPVCERPLTADDVRGIEGRRSKLKEASEKYSAAKTHLKNARDEVLRLCSGLPRVSAELASQVELPAGLSDELAALQRVGDHTDAQVVELLKFHSGVLALLNECQTRAQSLLQDADDEFRKLTQPVEEWVELATKVAADKEAKKVLTQAKTWLKDAMERHRDRRFEPLQEATLDNWRTMSSGSSVLLNGVKLASGGTRRKIQLDVAVDGNAAPGVGVLSQGEINCMALSLFLPKAMHSDGPFRFVVIDDPVQAMDQVKVDGLARVLHKASEKLQVVVLTHDARLMASLRRLQLPCHVLEVRRTAGSVLLVTTAELPHDRFLRDAERLSKGEGLGDELPRRLVPGFCRLAVEAACNQRVFRDRLDAGATFREVEEQLDSLKSSLHRLLGLALLADEDKGGDVPDYLKNNGGHGECWAIFQMKKTHGQGSSLSREELVRLVYRSRDLCTRALSP